MLAREDVDMIREPDSEKVKEVKKNTNICDTFCCYENCEKCVDKYLEAVNKKEKITSEESAIIERDYKKMWNELKNKVKSDKDNTNYITWVILEWINDIEKKNDN